MDNILTVPIHLKMTLTAREAAEYSNVLEGEVNRVIFEGATAQLRVNVRGHEVRADVSGNQRITLNQRNGKVWLGFDEVTLIRK